MTNVEKLLIQVQHAKTLLLSAEAALSSPTGDDAAKVDAASVGIEEAQAAFADLTKLLAQCKGDVSRGPSIEDIRQVGLRRHAEDQAKTAAGKTVN